MVNELTVPVTSMATASIGLPVGLLATKQPLGPESGPTVDPVNWRVVRNCWKTRALDRCDR